MGSPFIIFFPYSRILLNSHYTQNLSVTQLASCEIVLQSFPHITVFHCNNLNLASFISFSSLQSLSLARLFVTPWTAACQASLSITNSWSLFKLMAIEQCHPTILSSVIPFCSHLQSFPSSGSFQMSQFFTSVGQSIGVSASASIPPI